MGIRMFTVARSIALASFPPDLPLEEVRRRLFARLYGDMAEECIPEQLRRRSWEETVNNPSSPQSDCEDAERPETLRVSPP